MPQLSAAKRPAFDDLQDGVLLLIWGYFLKIVVADRAALFVAAVYAPKSEYEGWFYIVATLLFCLQLYGDFGGCSVMAMGTAKILGIDLIDNFNAPYFSQSIAEFWRQWHISLSTWFWDYLYIPLGGNRKGALRKYLNVLVTFAADVCKYRRIKVRSVIEKQHWLCQVAVVALGVLTVLLLGVYGPGFEASNFIYSQF